MNRFVCFRVYRSIGKVEPIHGTVAAFTSVPLRRFGCLYDQPLASRDEVKFQGTVFYRDLFDNKYLTQFCWDALADKSRKQILLQIPCDVPLKVR